MRICPAIYSKGLCGRPPQGKYSPFCSLHHSSGDKQCYDEKLYNEMKECGEVKTHLITRCENERKIVTEYIGDWKHGVEKVYLCEVLIKTTHYKYGRLHGEMRTNNARDYPRKNFCYGKSQQFCIKYKNDCLHGESIGWYDDDCKNLHFKENRNNGLRHGSYEEKGKNGESIKASFVNGKLEGQLIISKITNGVLQVTERSNYKQDLQHGTSEYYSGNTLIHKEYYVLGKEINLKTENLFKIIADVKQILKENSSISVDLNVIIGEMITFQLPEIKKNLEGLEKTVLDQKNKIEILEKENKQKSIKSADDERKISDLRKMFFSKCEHANVLDKFLTKKTFRIAHLRNELSKSEQTVSDLQSKLAIETKRSVSLQTELYSRTSYPYDPKSIGFITTASIDTRKSLQFGLRAICTIASGVYNFVRESIKCHSDAYSTKKFEDFKTQNKVSRSGLVDKRRGL